jgi:hypothetical protein
MSPAEVSRALRLRLAGELKVDLRAIERRAEAVSRLSALPSAEAPAAEPHVRTLALAFEIERFYTAVEATLERLLEGLDGGAPRGAHWHSELLRAASVPLPGLRPELISPEAATNLRDLLGFQHFARHAYDAEPNPMRVDELARTVLGVASELSRTLGALVTHLEG